MPFNIVINVINYGDEDLIWIKIHDNSPCNLKTNQINCENYSGCYWYNSGCHSISPPTSYIEDMMGGQQLKTYTLCFTSGITMNKTFDVSVGHYLNFVIPSTEICTWITDHGGATGLDITEVFEIVDSYLYSTPPTGYSFIPTITQIMGTVDYYLGFTASGNTKTGCSF